MKILLIGPCPPPHGGVSVHLAGVRQELLEAGIPCMVLDPARTSSKARFLLTVLRYALRGWMIHVHTNGHNHRSWLLIGLCGLAAVFGRGALLTLHSGIAPSYLANASAVTRRLLRVACYLFSRIICVSPAIRSSLVLVGVPSNRIDITPACLAVERSHAPVAPLVASWMEQHRPLFSSVLFFQPEYGFDLLVAGLSRLRPRYPSFGCLVMGGVEGQSTAQTMVRRAGLADHFLVLGDVNHETCLALMARCDVFLRPTLADGDSISVREALALDVPVVASRVGARPEGVILFEPGDVDAMLPAIDHAIAQHRRLAEPVTGCMERLMEIYQQVASPGRANVAVT